MPLAVPGKYFFSHRRCSKLRSLVSIVSLTSAGAATKLALDLFLQDKIKTQPRAHVEFSSVLSIVMNKCSSIGVNTKIIGFSTFVLLLTVPKHKNVWVLQLPTVEWSGLLCYIFNDNFQCILGLPLHLSPLLSSQVQYRKGTKNTSFKSKNYFWRKICKYLTDFLVKKVRFGSDFAKKF